MAGADNAVADALSRPLLPSGPTPAVAAPLQPSTASVDDWPAVSVDVWDAAAADVGPDPVNAAIAFVAP
jgi:hypothetical protein